MIKFKKCLSAKNKQRNKLRKSGKSSTVTRNGGMFKNMHTTANLSLVRKGLPLDVRALILEKTSYSNPMKSIEPYKQIIGEKTFLDFIQALSAKSPPWLLEVMQQFIELLKFTPNLPPVLIPFHTIVTEYIVRALSNPRAYILSLTYIDEYIQNCNETVERFITENELDTQSELVKKIKDFFNNIVRVSSTHIKLVIDSVRYMDSNYLDQLPFNIKTNFKRLIPFLDQLFILNQTSKIHKGLIKYINLKEWLEYGKAEREFTIAQLKKESPSRYNQYDTSKWNEKLIQLAVERDEARRRRRHESQSQGGTRRKMRAHICM
jgi:hypothetical protein